MTDSKEQAEQKGEEVKRARTRWRKRKRESEVRQGEPVIVVGSTKLPGSTTATFDGSNHEDAMTTQSPTSSTTRLSSIGLVAAIYLLLATQICSAAYYGKLIGKLSELHHGVSGEVYAVDGRTLFIKDFTYDGEAPTAYFYVGTSKSPNGNGIRLRDERGSSNTLKRYRRKDITLTLPDGKTLSNVKWFAVWCDEFSVNFGDVRIPRGFDYPKPQKLAALNGVHGVSSEPIVVVDAQTLLIPSFSYDGEAPDAKFWVGAGPSPSPQGIRVPDENGKEQPLRRYDRKAIVLTLPGDLTIHQIGHFGVWCEAFTVDFGHVQIPQGLNVPPSLKMLGVSPQNVHRGGQGQTLGLTNLYELATSASSSSPASPSPSPSLASALLTQQQYQQPTTYRPILRREDQVQVVQAIDYRIPKSLQTQEPLAQQLHRHQSASYPTPVGRPTAIVQYGDDVTNLDDATYQEQYRSANGQPSVETVATQPVIRSRSRSQPTSEPQPNSYSRFLQFQGDRRVDSFVRY
ncbi:protein Skeletor, isoforms B/C isoform X3 [Bombus huntii]|uniref:protein Skeletor, isoforms B/C isoform X3 n=1 Tax=Bombus huntii TaxID=85661 RepID=UPI0021AB0A4C|nr:protein Skeletor, isoforms B/C isoform X3 [Bombus huntii]